MLIVTNEIRIAFTEFEFSFSRSSGPGGQNVNKVNSKACLRWCPVTSAGLPEAVRARFLARFGGQLTAEGDLLLVSDRYRDQPRNKEDCLEKLADLLRQVAQPPKARRKTRPTRGSQQRRQQGKRLRGETKKGRGRVFHDD